MSMENPTCPACHAVNEDDAAYCDQCGQPLSVPEAVDDGAGGCCPACGGAVEIRDDGKGVCSRCGLELVEVPEPSSAKADAGTVARLTAAILSKTRAGRSVEEAVAEGCREVFDAPPPEPAAKNEGEPILCPLCGENNPGEAARCGGCGLWFQGLRSSQQCSLCERSVFGDGKCECGAILTLPKLLEYIESSVRWICARCKAPYARTQANCPDCGGELLSSERIKAYAASLL